MLKAAAMILTLMLSSGQALAAEAEEAQKSEGSKGITLQELGRGLKSAEQNIEKEIPKIGPAIADTVKKLSGKDSEKTSPDSPEKQKP
jgi:hypothetical protein